MEKFKACDFSKIPDEDYKTDMSRLGAISLEPNTYRSSEEERKTVNYLKNGIAFELAKRGVFAGSEKAKDTETSEPSNRWSDQYNKSLDTLRVGEEITLPGLDKYISPFADAKHDRKKIISIFNSMNEPGKLNDSLHGDMLKQLDASGLIDDELGNKILEMVRDPNKVFLTAYSNWRESGDRGGYRWKDGLFRYIVKDKNNHYLLQLADRDNSKIGEYMEVYDFKKGCKYTNLFESESTWFPAIYSTLKEHGLFPHIPRLTTAGILSNKNGRGDEYIKITEGLDERIKSDAERYSLMETAPMLDKELPQGDQDLQETANEKQSTLGAESEIKETGLNPVTRVLDRNLTETVSLPPFDKSTRLNRDFSKDNHRKVYESLGELSDKDLSVLSRVIRKTTEVTVPSSVAGFLRELRPELSSIAPLQRQALVDTSIQVRKALQLGLVNDNTLPSLMPDFPVSAYDGDEVAKKVGLLLEISSRIDKMKELGIFNEEQALSLKQNMGAQASEEMYLHRQNGLLEKITYLADYAKREGKSFGPDQVNSLITNKSIIDDQIQRGLIIREIDGKPSAALKEKQILTLDWIAVHRFAREFLKKPDMGSTDFHRIERAGKKILENTSLRSDSTQTSENNTRLVEKSIQPSQDVPLNDSPDAPEAISQCLGDVINRGVYGSIVYNPNQISSQDVKNAASKYPNITVIDIPVDLKGKQSDNWLTLGRQINDEISRLKLQKTQRIFLNLVANGPQSQKSLDELATEHEVLRGAIDSLQNRSYLSTLIRSTLNGSANRIIFAVPLTTDTFHVRSQVGLHLVLEKTDHDYILKNS